MQACVVAIADRGVELHCEAWPINAHYWLHTEGFALQRFSLFPVALQPHFSSAPYKVARCYYSSDENAVPRSRALLDAPYRPSGSS